ncbi:transposase [Acetobacter sicerae]|uniref:transposase n=1 Tax=Acetobacter sicerae TaxID=85325 RepID=UPI0038D0F65F
MVDAAGKAVTLSLTPGQRTDITEAEPLLDEVDPEVFIADKAYDAGPLIEKLEERGISHVIKNEISSNLLRQTEAVQRHCNALRQAEINLHRSTATRLRCHRRQLTTHPRPCAAFFEKSGPRDCGPLQGRDKAPQTGQHDFGRMTGLNPRLRAVRDLSRMINSGSDHDRLFSFSRSSR